MWCVTRWECPFCAHYRVGELRGDGSSCPVEHPLPGNAVPRLDGMENSHGDKQMQRQQVPSSHIWKLEEMSTEKIRLIRIMNETVKVFRIDDIQNGYLTVREKVSVRAHTRSDSGRILS